MVVSTLLSDLREEITGIYRALYNFEDDADDAAPDGWTVNAGANCHAKIIAEKTTHKKVLEIWDNSETTNVTTYQAIDRTSGAVEFWHHYNEGGTAGKDVLYLLLKDGATTCIYIAFYGNNNNKIEHYDVGTLKTGYTKEAWHHIRLVFDCTTDTFTFFVDGEQCGGTHNFNTAGTTIDKIEFVTSVGYTMSQTYHWLDAIDFSWATNYHINRNTLLQTSWDQVNYFATIIVADPTVESLSHYPPRIVIALKPANVRVMQLGSHTGRPRHEEGHIIVMIAVDNVNMTFEEKTLYLLDVLTEFRNWMATKEYTNIELTQILLIELRADLWLKYYEVT